MSPKRRRPDQSPSQIALFLAAFFLLWGCESETTQIDEIRALHEEMRFEDTIEPLEGLMRTRVDDPELQYMYGVALMGTGRPSLGLWSLRSAREHPEWAVRAGMALAQAAVNSGDGEAAMDAASRVLEIEPENRTMLALRAEAHLKLKDYEAALEDADRLVEIDPGALEAEGVRLRAYVGLERIDAAEGLFADFEERWDDEGFREDLGARYCAAHGRFAQEQGKLDLAKERYERCLERFPLRGALVTEAIEFFDQQGRPERGNEILRGVLEADPARAQVRETLASRLRRAKRLEEAEQILREGTALEDWVALQAWGALGHHFFELEDYEASFEAWERVIAIVGEPESDLRFGYAEVLLRSGRHERALEEAQRLPEVQGELIRGLVRLEQRRPEDALAHFSAGLRLWPNNAVARYYAAIAAEEVGDFDQAISHYRDSVRAGAEHTDAGLRLARLHKAEGAHEPARQALLHYLKAHPDDLEAQLLALRVAKQMDRPTTGAPDVSGFGWAGALGGMSGIARVSQIFAAADGAEAGIAVLQNVGDLDWTAPPVAPALRVLVAQLCAAGQPEEARRKIDAALAAHPDAADFYEIRGLWLEETRAPRAAARAAYEKALELDADHAPALAALGRLALAEGHHEKALRYYRRAAEDDRDTESRFRAAELASRAGAQEEAVRRLENLLEDEPYDARAAGALARLLAGREGEIRRVQALNRRAERFGREGADPGQEAL